MSTVIAAYRRLPEDVRRCLRPLNLAEEVAARLPEPLREPALDLMDRTRRLLHLRHARFPRRRLTGCVGPTASRLTALVAADGVSSAWWREILFAEPPTEALLDTLDARALVATSRRQVAADVDLAVWQHPWPLPRPRDGALIVPSWTPLWLDVTGGLEAVVRGERSGRAARKNDLRRVQRLALTVRAGDAADLLRFATDLYAPHVARRFGALGVPRPLHALRRAHRRGWLLMLERDGRPEAGVLVERDRDGPCITAFGATASAAAAGAIEACYCAAIERAAANGDRRLALGATRPLLTDGVLRYKRKWGARLGTPATRDRFVVRYRNTPATRAALTASPLVVEHVPGVLAALVGAEGVDPGAQLRQLDTPGLAQIVLLTGDARGPCPRAPHTPVRVVPAPAVWPPGSAFAGV
jgi:hypothetical protein